jgi:crotonobetainyl-CoA:carnitine CoA-transferase CaiB-like acyl-CoA transferase
MLEGIRVVEVGVWVAGPSAGGLLAEWGADVIKVETEAGDPMRRVFSLISGHGQPESPPFDLDNRGKRSVVLDLSGDDGAEAMARLLATADVFITNLRPEATERLGLGPDDLLPVHPSLVYASVTGYGRQGPDADRAGYDVGAFWARSGIARTISPEDDPLIDIRSGLGDHVTGITTAAGIVTALLARQRQPGHPGGLVETSLLRTGMWCLGWDLGIQLRFDKLAPTMRRERLQNAMCNSYRAADGEWFWLLGVESDRMWPKLVAAIGRPDLVEDERFATGRGRRHHAEEVVGELDRVFAEAPMAVWRERFDTHDVWWAPANTAAEAVEDPQALASGAVVDVPAGVESPAHRAIASPITFGGRPTKPAGPVPALGQHTAEVLEELGLG